MRRRRSASPASTIRAREARSASRRARSSASSRPFSIASAAVPAAACEQLGRVAQLRGVDERAHAPPAVGDLRHDAPVAGRDRHRCAVAVDVAALLGQPVGDRERRVAERRAQRVAHAAASGREPVDQPPDRATRKERLRTRPATNAAGSSANAARNASWVASLSATRATHAEHDDRRPEPEHRVEPAALDPARRAAATDEQHDRGDEHRRHRDRLQPLEHVDRAGRVGDRRSGCPGQPPLEHP